MDLKGAKEFSVECVRYAGDLLTQRLDGQKELFFKGEYDVFTDVDGEISSEIIDRIRNRFPDHSILSEEEDFIEGDSEYVWVLDPLDGTVNYYHRSRPFGVALCLVKGGEPIISTIYEPTEDLLFVAEKGCGSTLNGKEIKVNANKNLGDSVVLTHISSTKPEARRRTISKLDGIVGEALHLRILGSSVASFTSIANGNFEAYFNLKTYPWDILPGSLIVEESGGRVTEIDGSKIDLKSDSVLATNGNVHEEMLELLEGI